MSGVCGIINLDGAPVRREDLRGMTEAAAHRGQDGIRYWSDGGAGLAHLSLDVTPESVYEKQPLVSQHGDLVLAADARVDNREELIRTLRPGGYLRDKYPTDADLILASYRRWGGGCPERIIGDFAFVIWNAARGRLFAARDPMAMRSLYYRVEPRRLLLATEVKQILAVPDIPARLFEPMVGAHLAAQDGQPEWTFHEGISQLPPAHALAADATGFRTWRYWDIDPGFRIEHASEEEYAGHFLEVFEEAVRCRLRSVNPVGVLLSGGLDSSSVASTAGWLLQRDGAGLQHDFQAYSWAFEELTQCDERHVSDVIAARYGFPVTPIPAEENWPLKNYPAHGPDRDGPYSTPYQALIERALTEAESRDTRVMFSGHRGDLMAGMWIFDYLGLLRAGRWPELWRELREHERLTGVPASRVARMYLMDPIKQSLWPRGRAEWLRQPARRMLGRHRSAPPYPGWVREEFAERAGVAGLAEGGAPRPGMSSFARDERYRAVFLPLHMQVAAWSERLMSRFGVSYADPWSDRRLASFVLAVPQKEINRAGENKRLLRRSMSGVMPEEARKAAGKTSPAPLYHRALTEQARETVLGLLEDSQAGARGYVDEGAVKSYYEAFSRGQVREDHRFWHTLTLEMWLRQHWS